MPREVSDEFVEQFLRYISHQFLNPEKYPELLKAFTNWTKDADKKNV